MAKTPLAEAMRDAVEYLGLGDNLKEFAHRADVSQVNVSRWLHGGVKSLSQAKMRSYENRLKLPPGFLSDATVRLNARKTPPEPRPRGDGPLTHPPDILVSADRELTPEEARVVSGKVRALLQKGLVAEELYQSRAGRDQLRRLWACAGKCMADNGYSGAMFFDALLALDEAERGGGG